MKVKKSHRGAAFADFNNDGQMDIAVSALDDAPSLLMNGGVAGNYRLMVRLKGAGKNRFGIGARVTVTAGGVVQIREVKAGGSYASASDPRAHFGLGSEAAADEVTVRWRSGKVTRVAGVKAGGVVTIEEAGIN